ncbi:MAG TPA: phosphatase PAP2 family protein [Burkholderiaceae bacterium]|nr:phosphatase PAP2 family protein [Burkholderiaceae bacterium]
MGRFAVLTIAVFTNGAVASSDATREAGDVLSVAMPVATLGVELWRGERTGALQFTESFVVTVAATELLKRTTHVERPDGTNDQSFPSGHASRAFASATYVHRRYGWQHAWPLYGLATYVGYTRVASDRHRWADVAGSAAVAALSSWWLVDPKQPATTSLDTPIAYARAASDRQSWADVASSTASAALSSWLADPKQSLILRLDRHGVVLNWSTTLP